MNDGAMKRGDARRTAVAAAMCVAAVLEIAVVASIGLACSGTGFDLVTISAQMTWGAGGYTVAIAALVLAFAVPAAPIGRRDERPNHANDNANRLS